MLLKSKKLTWSLGASECVTCLWSPFTKDFTKIWPQISPKFNWLTRAGLSLAFLRLCWKVCLLSLVAKTCPFALMIPYLQLLARQPELLQFLGALPLPTPTGRSPLMLSRCVKKKDCLWKSSMARTMGPSRLLRRVFLEPLLSAISDSSMVRTMYSLKKKGRWEGQGLALHPGEKVALCCISSLFFFFSVDICP